MPRIDWPLLLSLQAATILAALWLARTAARRCAKQAAAQPTQRAEALFQFGRTVAALPLIALIAPYVLWGEAGPRRPPQLGAWLFAVGWTGYLVAWLGATWIASSLVRSVRPDGVTLRASITGALFSGGWFLLGPLFAGWAAVAATFVEFLPAGRHDPTQAACFVFGLSAAQVFVNWQVRSQTRTPAQSAPVLPPAVSEAFARAAGDGVTPVVVVAPLARAGVPVAYAIRRRRRALIVVDADLVASYPPEETTAVLLHELGHHRLGHLRRREWTWKACLFVVLIVPTLLGWGHVAVFLVGTWLVRSLVLPPQWRRQEFEADRFAADRSNALSIASALARIHRRQDIPDDFGRARREMSHPDLIRRVEALGLTVADVAPTAG